MDWSIDKKILFRDGKFLNLKSIEWTPSLEKCYFEKVQDFAHNQSVNLQRTN